MNRGSKRDLTSFIGLTPMTYDVSWVLRTTDPEILDATARLAGVIRWLCDGINIDLPYDLPIASMSKACFSLTGKLYPGSRVPVSAYHSGRAVMWIHNLAMCRSEGCST